MELHSQFIISTSQEPVAHTTINHQQNHLIQPEPAYCLSFSPHSGQIIHHSSSVHLRGDHTETEWDSSVGLKLSSLLSLFVFFFSWQATAHHHWQRAAFLCILVWHFITAKTSVLTRWQCGVSFGKVPLRRSFAHRPKLGLSCKQLTDPDRTCPQKP